jgi:hypothetical protein
MANSLRVLTNRIVVTKAKWGGQPETSKSFKRLFQLKAWRTNSAMIARGFWSA